MKNVKKVIVFARAYNRYSGKPVGQRRHENIDLMTNVIFKDCLTILDIKNAYEAFWNDLNPRSTEIVFVQDIVLNESM